MALYDYLAIEGGGSKGFAYLGVGEELESLGILKDIKAISGTSVGAIAALLFATGWSMDKIKTEFMSMNFEEMVKGGLLGSLLIPYDIFNNFGVFRATAFEEKFQSIIKEVTGDANCTFRQWHEFKENHPELGLKDLFIEACNVETKLNETFSHLSEHNDVPIAKAIRASMAYPGIFTQPVIKGVRYADGGTENNCPSRTFEDPVGEFNPKTLTIRLDDINEIRYIEEGIKPPAKKPKNFIDAMIAVFSAATNSQNYDFHESPYKEKTIFCDTLNVGTLDFNLSEDKKSALIASGQYATVSYFDKNHPELTATVFDKPTLDRMRAAKYPLTIQGFFSQKVLETKTAASKGSSSNENAKSSKASTPLFQEWRQLKEFKDIKEVINPQQKNAAKAESTQAKPKPRASARINR